MTACKIKVTLDDWPLKFGSGRRVFGWMEFEIWTIDASTTHSLGLKDQLPVHFGVEDSKRLQSLSRTVVSKYPTAWLPENSLREG